MEWPALAELAPEAFPSDVMARAKELQEAIGSIGAYSDGKVFLSFAKMWPNSSKVNPSPLCSCFFF